MQFQQMSVYNKNGCRKEILYLSGNRNFNRLNYKNELGSLLLFYVIKILRQHKSQDSCNCCVTTEAKDLVQSQRRFRSFQNIQFQFMMLTYPTIFKQQVKSSGILAPFPEDMPELSISIKTHVLPCSPELSFTSVGVYAYYNPVHHAQQRKWQRQHVQYCSLLSTPQKIDIMQGK